MSTHSLLDSPLCCAQIHLARSESVGDSTRRRQSPQSRDLHTLGLHSIFASLDAPSSPISPVALRSSRFSLKLQPRSVSHRLPLINFLLPSSSRFAITRHPGFYVAAAHRPPRNPVPACPALCPVGLLTIASRTCGLFAGPASFRSCGTRPMSVQDVILTVTKSVSKAAIASSGTAD